MSFFYVVDLHKSPCLEIPMFLMVKIRPFFADFRRDSQRFRII